MNENKLTNRDILNKLKENNEDLKKYSVRKIGLFGSYAKGDSTENSDIDFIVEFENPTFDNYMDLVFYLENLFRRNVDILTPLGLKKIRIKKVAKEINRSIMYV